MDLSLIVDVGWKVGLLLAGLGSMLWAAAKWGSRKSFVTREEFEDWLDRHGVEHDKIKDRFNRGDLRFTEVEATLAHLPTKADLAELTKSVASMAASLQGMRSEVTGMDKRLQGLSEQVTMLVENELKGAAR